MNNKKSPAELLQEREKRVMDAVALRVPDRVPIIPAFAFFPAKYTGVTCEDAFFNPLKWKEACKKVLIDFEPDLWQFASVLPGLVMQILGCKQVLLPGHGTSPYHTHQFVEGEYMTAGEWEAFKRDPGDLAIRTYIPRVFEKLKILQELPPLDDLVTGGGVVGVLDYFTRTEFIEAFDLIVQAGEAMTKWRVEMGTFGKDFAELGYAAYSGAATQAPFDLITDFMRGMRGSMLDLYRHPDELLEACEIFTPLLIERTIAMAKASGNPRVFIPLHRGAEGFMSLKQFEKFYWPTLKKVLLALIDAGLTPAPFFEGGYTTRLEYLLELPKGKIIGHFDTTDIFKAKQIIGNHICIRGDMPPSLLQTGTPEQIKEYTKKLIDIVGKDGGYIMSTRGSLDEAEPELVRIWVDFTKEYGVYR